MWKEKRIGWLLQEKTGQALGSTSFNVRPRMPSLNCDINDLFGPTEANSSFCHKWSDWHHPHTTEANQFQFWEPEHGPVIGRTWILYHQSQSQSQRRERKRKKKKKKGKKRRKRKHIAGYGLVNLWFVMNASRLQQKQWNTLEVKYKTDKN